MDLLLKRNEFQSAGIFGLLMSLDKSCIVAHTLEHSYVGSNEPICYIPKLPPGVYLCERGMHQLEGMSFPFETFEITHVPGHTQILLHVGNTNDDSAGCVLLGSARSNNMITQSRIAFAAFMKLQAGIDTFKLVVE
jgi:hypothetical protein